MFLSANIAKKEDWTLIWMSIGQPLVRSHLITTPSLPIEYIIDGSNDSWFSRFGEFGYSIATIGAVCPLRVRTQSPVDRFHSFMLLSTEAVATRFTVETSVEVIMGVAH